MINIRRSGNGYRLNFSETGFGHFSADAKDIEEVKLAIQHYYEKSNPPDDRCPLCRRRDSR